MKKKLPKSKRPKHFLQHKKSSRLSQLSLKKTPKRRVKNLVKKIVASFIVSFSIFVVSMLSLWIIFHHASGIISPVPIITNVLGTTTEKNTATIIGQYKDALQKKNIAFSSVTMQNADVIVTIHDDIQVVFSSDKDISVQIDSLQVTMDNLTIEGKRIARVDMRFERPVVTFK